jgi:hypothetical protein
VGKGGRIEQATYDNVIRRMRFADTHAEYVILIAFPRQQLLCERASMIRVFVHSLYC